MLHAIAIANCDELATTVLGAALRKVKFRPHAFSVRYECHVDCTLASFYSWVKTTPLRNQLVVVVVYTTVSKWECFPQEIHQQIKR